MTIIQRISDTVIDVDGIECVKEADGRYYPTMPELCNVSFFPEAIDAFLQIESNLEDTSNLVKWDSAVNDLLNDLNISYVNN